ncbi:hypothetical protein PMZ80_008910 [Knufia obscura]|uniref:Uncharacterized protein n=2 Tax=Knufia TaxID=430999 RepID=A0AAN8I8Z3_9EURO|nr:hypothetical protein PMZ80_008910 [Knufia obscura]KAK5955131.1 hypothetical protein OHC33_003810 [Knufia fluminis]
MDPRKASVHTNQTDETLTSIQKPAVSAVDNSINATSAALDPKDIDSTQNDIPPLSELDGIDGLEDHWRDEPDGKENPSEGAAVSEKATRSHAEAVSGEQDLAGRHVVTLNTEHGSWLSRLQQEKEDWNREVLRVDLC